MGSEMGVLGLPDVLRQRAMAELGDLERGALIGRGSFGRVYKGRWRGAGERFWEGLLGMRRVAPLARPVEGVQVVCFWPFRSNSASCSVGEVKDQSQSRLVIQVWGFPPKRRALCGLGSGCRLSVGRPVVVGASWQATRLARRGGLLDVAAAAQQDMGSEDETLDSRTLRGQS